MVQYEYESELIWDKDPSGLEYVREFEINTRRKEGIDNKYKDMYNVFGWTNLDFDAPPIGINNIYSKRIFVIKDTDIGGSRHTNEFKMGGPSEAVEIDSIEAGKESNEHTLTIEDIERIFNL